MLHNIDTLGANLDARWLGRHITSGVTLSFEVTARRFEDRGGGLARVADRLRIVEGLALPREEDESKLTYYNALTTWISVDPLLALFGLSRRTLNDPQSVLEAVRTLAARLPTYITIKEVKRRWGHAQEDIFPVTQFEKTACHGQPARRAPARVIGINRMGSEGSREGAAKPRGLEEGVVVPKCPGRRCRLAQPSHRHSPARTAPSFAVAGPQLG